VPPLFVTCAAPELRSRRQRHQLLADQQLMPVFSLGWLNPEGPEAGPSWLRSWAQQ
jgi:hypothetical protein